jgi:hypothetical protein
MEQVAVSLKRREPATSKNVERILDPSQVNRVEKRSRRDDVNQDTRIGGFNMDMANLDAHYHTRNAATQPSPIPPKWSGRRSIAVALGASAILWTLIFFIAKAISG